MPDPNEPKADGSPPGGPTAHDHDDAEPTPWVTVAPLTANAPAAEPAPPPRMPLAPPPGYELLGVLGRGGMGVVYRARQVALKRDVALKVMQAGGPAAEDLRQRFLAEAEAVAAVNHPGVVQVHDFGTWDGQPFLALELCTGGTLAQSLRVEPMPPPDAAALVERVARGVAAAHARGVVHRDLKPANILLDAGGAPKVADFGLAKITAGVAGLTRSGALLGTPGYMSPEQARGGAKRVGPAADVYSLGAVLYECLTGRPPFRGAIPADTLQLVLTSPPTPLRAVNPAVPAELETVCLKCLEKDPAARYPTAEALADDLRRWLDGRPMTASAVEPVGGELKGSRRNTVVTALLITVVGSLGIGVAVTYSRYRDETARRAVAEQAREEAVTEAAAMDRALQALTAEKAAAEAAYLDGLARALFVRHGSAADGVGRVEAAALRDLASLPDARLREAVFARWAARPPGTDRLLDWRRELVGAVAGLDRTAADRLRDDARRRLVGGSGGEAEVAAAWLAELPGADRETDARAVRVLSARLPVERNPAALGHLAAALTRLAARLPEAEAVAVLRPAARTLADRVASEPEVFAAANLARRLASLVERLPADEAATVARPAARKVFGLLDGTSDAGVASAAVALAGWVDAPDLGPAARRLATRVAGERDAAAVAQLSRALAAVAGRLPPAESAAVLGPVAVQLSARLAVLPLSDSDAAASLADALAVVAGRLPPTEAVVVVGTTGHTVAARILAAREAGVVLRWAVSAGSLAEWVDRAEAGALAREVARAVESADVNQDIGPAALGLARLARHLPPAEAAELCDRVARAVTARIPDERPGWSSALRTQALAELAPQLTDAGLARLLRENVMFVEVREAALAEFGHRSGRFGDVWEFVAWAERHRPELDLRSRPLRP